jgi:hypothetical protein
VHQVLTNEKYIGNNVFNRISYKLKQKRVINPADQWVKAEGVFAGIIDRDFFEAAQRIIQDRSRRFNDDELLKFLSELLAAKGWLSGLVIDEVEGMPSSSTFRHRFGSLVRAYKLVGYAPPRDYRYLDTNRYLRALHPTVVADVMAQVEGAGGMVRRDPVNDLLRINEEFSASLVIARCHETAAGGHRWKVRFDTGLRPDITIVARMAAGNEAIRDFYVLPWIGVAPAPSLKLASDNGVSFDAFRFDTLAPFFDLTRRTPHRRAA